MKDDKSGSGGVRISSELQALNQAQAVTETRPGEDRPCRSGEHEPAKRQVRSVAGRTFYLNNGTWIDASIQGLGRVPLTRIAFASEAYFALLKERAGGKGVPGPGAQPQVRPGDGRLSKFTEMERGNRPLSGCC